MQEETVLEQLLSSRPLGTGDTILSTQQLQAVLQHASDVYYNSGQPAIPDLLFDQLKDALQLRDPTSPFLSQIGAPVLRNRVPLPFGLYSLDKVKPGSKDLGKWQAKYPGPFCISDKLDGTSCLIVYELSGDKWQVKLMTRGKPALQPPLFPVGQHPQPTPLSSTSCSHHPHDHSSPTPPASSAVLFPQAALMFLMTPSFNLPAHPHQRNPTDSPLPMHPSCSTPPPPPLPNFH